MERILDDAETEAILERATIGRIGCRYGDSVYVVPVTYVYDSGSIYGHSADGLKLRLMRAEPRVCFEVEDDSVDGWSSAIAWGTFEELEGEAAEDAMGRLLARLAPERAHSDAAPAQGHGHGTGGVAHLWAIRVDTSTGRAGWGA